MSLGVTVTVEEGSAPSSSADASARYFVAGLTERGPVTPTSVASMLQYNEIFGTRQAYTPVYDDLLTFFSEGGGEAVVCRAVGPAATAGKLDLLDRAAVTPLNTLTINAASPGAWSSDLSVQVTAGTRPGTYRIRVFLDGDPVESYNNLVSPADAVAALQASAYVRGVDRGSATAAPNNQPAVQGSPVALSAGVDDRAAVTTAGIVAALNTAGSDFGGGVVALPGVEADLCADDVIAHCKTLGRVALLHGAVDADVTDIIESAEAVTDDGEFAGLVYPYVVIPDGRATRTVPPTGFVAACRAKAIASGGTWVIPARSEFGTASWVLAPAVVLSAADADALNEANVIPIRQIAGTTRLYGYRSLSGDPEYWNYLAYRDVVNSIARELSVVGENYMFRTLDGSGSVLATFGSELTGVLDAYRQNGALYTAGDDNGYSVDTGPGVNTTAVLAAYGIRAVVSVRLSPAPEHIDITLVRAQLTAAV